MTDLKERLGGALGRIKSWRWRSVLPVAVPLALLAYPVVRGADGPNFPRYEVPARSEAPPPTSPTSAPPLVPLPTVDGTTTLPPPPQSGTAAMTGTVLGPTGPVAGAVVRIDRFDRGRTTTVDAVSLPDGSWSAGGLVGGRYRVRAFLPPTLAQLEPDIFFLAAGEQKSLTLDVESFGGPEALASVAPDPPVVGERTTIAVRLATRAVDGNGVVRANPLSFWSVQLSSTGGWQIVPPASVVTDSLGEASFIGECRFIGASPVQVIARATATDPPTVLYADVPACVAGLAPPIPPPTSSTSTPFFPTTTTAPSTTSTTDDDD